MKRTFIEACINDPDLMDTDIINDYVEEWHSSIENNTSLYEYLGMTKQEYSEWVIHPEVLRQIVEKRIDKSIL